MREVEWRVPLVNGLPFPDESSFNARMRHSQSNFRFALTLIAAAIATSTLSGANAPLVQPTITSDLSSNQIVPYDNVTDTATLNNAAPGATGTIRFDVYGPNNATCGGLPIFTSSVLVHGNGVYTSAPFAPIATGTYRFVATYSGDAVNSPAATTCGDPSETLVVASNPHSGSVKGSGAFSSNIAVEFSAVNVRRRNRASGFLVFENRGLAAFRFKGTVTTLSIDGYSAHLSGVGTDGERRIYFDAFVFDRSASGRADSFAIDFSGGPNFSGTLVTGDFVVD